MGNNNTVKRSRSMQQAAGKSLEPLSNSSPIKRYEISLHVETGNVIYEKFDNVEDLLQFIHEYAHDSAKILERITPKKRRAE